MNRTILKLTPKKLNNPKIKPKELTIIHEVNWNEMSDFQPKWIT